MDVEQSARELLVAAYRGADYSPMMHESHNLIHGRPSRRERAALDAIIAALTPPEGYVLVPVQLVESIRLLAQIYEAGGDIDTKLWEVEDLLDASLGVKS